VSSNDDSSFQPAGSGAIAQWARMRRIDYRARPDQRWFRQWEPYATMVAAETYFNACSYATHPGTVVIVEPWTEPDYVEPMERTIMGFANHPGLGGRAAMRSGEHFITRVAFIESPPLPTVTVGDPVWDEHVRTFARSAEDAGRAFHPALRDLLRGWGFRGHIELRQGGLVVHYAGLQPAPAHYVQLSGIIGQLVATALQHG